MPVNGSNRPPWLKDRVETVNRNVPPAWARKTSTTTAPSVEAKDSKPPTKSLEPDGKTAPIVTKPAVPAPKPPAAAKENGEPAKTAKLQSKEIKVPIVIQQKKPMPPPLTKSEPMIKNTTPQMTVLRDPLPKPKPKPKEPSPESEYEEEEDEEEEEEEEEEEGSTEYETETESEEESPPPPPPVKKPEPKPAPKREPSPPKPKLAVELKKVVKPPEKSDTESKSSEKSEKSSSPEPKSFIKPPLKKVIRPQVEAPKERSTSPEPKNFRIKLRKVPSNLKAPRVKEKLPEVQLKRVEKPLLENVSKKEEAYPHKPSMLKSESSKRIPPPPPMPKTNVPPPPPPPPKLAPPPDFKKDAISDRQKQVVDKLKKRPRKRPDWSDMMKEVEQGRKLRHVECNDRSKPIIHSKSITKFEDQFIFETEKATAHNVLLKEIQFGVKLKPTKCNDRSKPNLEGLRKFRRQMTLEEQLAKSESRANLEAPPVEEDEVDEMDDIDKVRDDLQSTKQLLAMELRNNEALERENKRLLQRVQNLEAELSRERWNPLSGEEKSAITGPDAGLIQSLKNEALEAQQQSKQLEEKYQTVAKELDTAYKQCEEQKRKIGDLEKKIQGITDGGGIPARRISEAAQKESSPELAPEEEEEEEEEEDEEKKAEKVAKRLSRDVNMLSARLMRLKEKQEEKHAERQALKYAMKTNQYALKNERKKYKKLQKEVEKMAAMMKMEDEEDDAEGQKEPPPPEPEEEEEEEETEEESESESESDSESESANEAEDASDEKKKANLEPRVKRHESRLASLKKGNYLLQANVDRMKDEINKTREMCCTLQSDLDSVIADLG
ncbi:titin isoform X2 [Toxorhynchites rutilus septentrionalis]|uniref:titin isoform X2 n=1 Tax=Toxorhynchites rutilus septentrionalis TaxID=329112 RepID=UPI00247A8E9C|nr:titin isoform X2 [Toxorhynchites rutilus septentrionalis]